MTTTAATTTTMATTTTTATTTAATGGPTPPTADVPALGSDPAARHADPSPGGPTPASRPRGRALGARQRTAFAARVPKPPRRAT
jgi:hypothetical protein